MRTSTSFVSVFSLTAIFVTVPWETSTESLCHMDTASCMFMLRNFPSVSFLTLYLTGPSVVIITRVFFKIFFPATSMTLYIMEPGLAAGAAASLSAAGRLEAAAPLGIFTDNVLPFWVTSHFCLSFRSITTHAVDECGAVLIFPTFDLSTDLVSLFTPQLISCISILGLGGEASSVVLYLTGEDVMILISILSLRSSGRIFSILLPFDAVAAGFSAGFSAGFTASTCIAAAAGVIFCTLPDSSARELSCFSTGETLIKSSSSPYEKGIKIKAANTITASINTLPLSFIMPPEFQVPRYIPGILLFFRGLCPRPNMNVYPILQPRYYLWYWPIVPALCSARQTLLKAA